MTRYNVLGIAICIIVSFISSCNGTQKKDRDKDMAPFEEIMNAYSDAENKMHDVNSVSEWAKVIKECDDLVNSTLAENADCKFSDEQMKLWKDRIDDLHLEFGQKYEILLIESL